MTIHPTFTLDIQQHRHHGWHRASDCGFASAVHFIPLSLPELPTANGLYALAFMQPAPGQPFRLGAIVGVHADHNLYLTRDRRWSAPYVPAELRGYPFSLQEVPGNAPRQLAVCFDPSTGLHRPDPKPDQGEELFFADDGQLQPAVKSIVSFLQSQYQAHQLTQRGVDALQALNLLEPWVLPAELGHLPEQPLLQCYYRINEAALNQLAPEPLHTLHQANALGLAYAQLLSMPRLGILHRLALERKQQPQTPSPTPAPDSSIVATLFDPAHSDTIRFNF